MFEEAPGGGGREGQLLKGSINFTPVSLTFEGSRSDRSEGVWVNGEGWFGGGKLTNQITAEATFDDIQGDAGGLAVD